MENAKHKMDVVDKNPVTQILSGYENLTNIRCKWNQFLGTITDSSLCVWVSFL